MRTAGRPAQPDTRAHWHGGGRAAVRLCGQLPHAFKLPRASATTPCAAGASPGRAGPLVAAHAGPGGWKAVTQTPWPPTPAAASAASCPAASVTVGAAAVADGATPAVWYSERQPGSEAQACRSGWQCTGRPRPLPVTVPVTRRRDPPGPTRRSRAARPAVPVSLGVPPGRLGVTGRRPSDCHEHRD